MKVIESDVAMTGIEMLIVIGIAAVVIALIVVSVAIPFLTQAYVTVNVTDKERVTYTSGSGDDMSIESKYLIFSETETFENTDCLVLGKFDSSDLYGRVHEGHTYRFKVYGFRIPFFSMYRNIIAVEENGNAVYGEMET